MTKTKDCTIRYKNHAIRACRLPGGRVFPAYSDALRVLCTLLGMPDEVVATMPEPDSPNDAIPVFGELIELMSDRPETQAFAAWLHRQMTANGKRELDGEAVINGLRHFGADVTHDQVFQTLLESPDTHAVHEGDTTHIYRRRTGKLLVSRKGIQHDEC